MCALHFTAGKHPGYLLPRNLKWFEIQFMHLYYTSNSPRNCITPIHSPCSSPDSSEVFAVASPQDEQNFQRFYRYCHSRRDQKLCSRCCSTCSCPIPAQTIHNWLWKDAEVALRGTQSSGKSCFSDSGTWVCYGGSRLLFHDIFNITASRFLLLSTWLTKGWLWFNMCSVLLKSIFLTGQNTQAMEISMEKRGRAKCFTQCRALQLSSNQEVHWLPDAIVMGCYSNK